MEKDVIYLGADHAGFALKEIVKEYLTKRNYKVEDLGAHTFDKEDDYPDFAASVAKSVAKNKKSKGIIVCGSGQGVCIAANKVMGIRAVVPASKEEAEKTRSHNDANVLCLSGWHMPSHKALELVHTWITTDFSNEERHVRRLKKIEKLEK